MKFLYYPVKPYHLNQGFGENVDFYLKNYGTRGHNGLDMTAYHGQPVYAAHDGYAYYEIDDGGGHGVVIVSKDLYDYNGQQVRYKTIYWHLCNEKLEPQYTSPIKITDVNAVGQVVKAGDLIGYADNTGISTGSHLHFGLKPVTPSESNINGSTMTIGKDNGFQGAIDPTPYLNGLFAGDIKDKYQFTTDFGYHSLYVRDVYNLQKILVAGGFGKFTPTGFFGTLTLEAVKRYQTAHGIEETGFVGPITRAMLNN